jgi:hypothetical protein
MDMLFFPFLGMGENMTLLDPSLVFTPLTFGLMLLSGLCGIGITVLLSWVMERRPPREKTSHSKPPTLPKAA